MVPVVPVAVLLLCCWRGSSKCVFVHGRAAKKGATDVAIIGDEMILFI